MNDATRVSIERDLYLARTRAERAEDVLRMILIRVDELGWIGGVSDKDILDLARDIVGPIVI